MIRDTSTDNNHTYRIFSLPYIFLYVWFIYRFQEGFYTLGGISKILFGIQLAISLYYWVYAIFHYRFPIYMRALNILTIYLLSAGIIRYVNNETIRLTFEQGGLPVERMSYLRQYINSLLPVFVFYVAAKKKIFTTKDIKVWIIPFVGLATLQFIRYFIIHTAGTEYTEITNNTGYVFVSLIPAILFLTEKPKLQLILLGYCMVMIMMSMKRGAIMIGIILICYCLYNMVKSTKRGRIGIVFGVLVFLALSYWYVQEYMLSSDYFLRRLEQTLNGNSSNRDYLYSTFWNHIQYRMNSWALLFGYGADGTVKLVGQFAHNDWLEIFIDLGFIGFVLYLFYWVSLFKTCFYLKKRNHLYFSVLTCFVIMYFIKSFMSMSINSMTIYATCVVGYVMAQIVPRQKERK